MILNFSSEHCPAQWPSRMWDGDGNEVKFRISLADLASGRCLVLNDDFSKRLVQLKPPLTVLDSAGTYFPDLGRLIGNMLRSQREIYDQNQSGVKAPHSKEPFRRAPDGLACDLPFIVQKSP